MYVGKAAVDGPAGELRLPRTGSPGRSAETTVPACAVQPGHARPGCRARGRRPPRPSRPPRPPPGAPARPVYGARADRPRPRDRSVRQIAQARTLTRTSPGPGRGDVRVLEPQGRSVDGRRLVKAERPHGAGSARAVGATEIHRSDPSRSRACPLGRSMGTLPSGRLAWLAVRVVAIGFRAGCRASLTDVAARSPGWAGPRSP